MTYEEYLSQADRLEEQAAALRKQAEKAKKDAEARDQFNAELTEARTVLIDSILEYLEKLDINPMTDEETDTLIRNLEAALKEIEDTGFRIKALRERKYECKGECKNKPKTKEEKDEEAIRRFILNFL